MSWDHFPLLRQFSFSFYITPLLFIYIISAEFHTTYGIRNTRLIIFVSFFPISLCLAQSPQQTLVSFVELVFISDQTLNGTLILCQPMWWLHWSQPLWIFLTHPQSICCYTCNRIIAFSLSMMLIPHLNLFVPSLAS